MAPALSVVRSLVAPDAVLGSAAIYHVPRTVLLTSMLFVAVVSAALTASFNANALARELLLRRELARIERVMLNAPPEARERAGRAIRQQVMRQSGVFSIVGAAVLAVVRWLLVFYELWFVTRLLVQFAGGEEREIAGRKHLRSQYLVLLSLVPLVIAELVTALLLSTRDPRVFENAATFADYQEAVRISLSVVEVSGISLASLRPSIGFFLSHVTSPFVWWAGYVFVVGAGEVFRLDVRRAAMLALIITALLALQHGALQGAAGLLERF